MEQLDKLNPPQREGVVNTEGPVLILAGAGSGKTRVLTHRIAYLIQEKDVWPSQILAITFTNKAAAEMRERVEELVGLDVNHMWVSTFHSCCVRILRREIDKLGYNSNYVIYDSSDQQTLLKNCLKELNIDDKKFPPRAVGAAISNAKNKLLEPDKFSVMAEDYFEEIAAQVYPLYQRKLKENNAVDFDDLIMLTVKLLKQEPQVLSYYQNKFKYIMVDEYQDTNHAQYQLINLLAQGHKNLCVVGDDDQSIYKFRGADIKNIVDFEEDYPDAKVIKLEENYRSVGNILEAANAVVTNNVGRKVKKLWTAKEAGDKIIYKEVFDEHEEARFVVQNIQRIHQLENKPYTDFAILYRTNGQSRVFEDWLRKLGVPYRIFGGLGFYQRKEIKDIMAYLKLIANPADTIALERIINVPKRGIGDASFAKLEEFALVEGITVGQAFEQVEQIPTLSARAKNGMGAFRDMVDSFKAKRKELSVTDLAEEVMGVTGYLAELKDSKDPQAQTRLENLKEFLSVTTDYDKHNKEGSLEDFLAQMSLFTDMDQDVELDDYVSLMTLHTAKGLEFPMVFLVGMEEGIFPHSRSMDDSAELEEERRLCYVGITRAEEKICLTHAQTRMLYGRQNNYLPSQFLQEIPKELFAESTSANRNSSPTNRDIKVSQAAFGSNEEPLFNIGDKVEHGKWGRGVIVSVKGEGGDAEISVAFPDVGIKSLLAKYAPLKKLSV
ncbi:DNA helicase-2/ATP-dependent DNA helicase PcrA [Desulfitispora alkaliphila]|uniref:DNA helicase PcrA n=1 Tax=Desulfitispora alkaliphila TaxID=622674 RepID=UPI003D1EB8B9